MNGKKIFLIILAAGFLFSQFFSFAEAEEAARATTLYLFYSKGCPHCEKELVFLEELEKEMSCLEIKKYEVQYDDSSRDLFLEAAEKLGIKNLAVPLTIVGENYLLGFDGPENMGRKIREMIESERAQCATAGTTESVSHPFFGKIALSDISLPFLTLVLGTLDGFNPCSMWSLLVLLTLVIATGSRKKVWLVGVVFIITSAVSYFVFMSAWLNAFILLEYVKIVRVLVGIAAVAAGAVSIREFYKFTPGACEASSPEQKNKIYGRIKKVLRSPGIAAIVIGVAAVAFSVNFIEMLCSLGMPVIYTKALTMYDLPGWKHYAYIGLYDFFYMLDDIIVLFAAGFSMKFLQFDGKYSRYSRLAAGILMIILGAIFLLMPELLAFK